ncbi:hypothetical protein D3C75_693700 [compost metagenome]
MFHLAENTVGNVIIAAPVGGTFSVSKLVHIMAVQFALQHFRCGIDFTRALHEMATTTIKLDLFHFAFCGAGWHDCDKRQT